MLCREANIRHSRVFLSVMFPEPFAQGVIDPGLPPGPGGLEGCQKVAVKADGGGCFCAAPDGPAFFWGQQLGGDFRREYFS
jgi:hypothetical protein